MNKWFRVIARILGVPSTSKDEENGFRSGMFPDHGLSLVPLGHISRTECHYLTTYTEGLEVLRKKRASMQKKLAKEINVILEPLGYERTESEWRKTSPFGRSYFDFQKSHYGFGCYFSAGTLGARDTPNPTLANTHDGFQWQRIAEFLPELPHNKRPDQLCYLCLHDNDGFSNAVMTVIQARMIPWMEARHRESSLISMPSPADMVAVKIFTEQGEP